MSRQPAAAAKGQTGKGSARAAKTEKKAAPQVVKEVVVENPTPPMRVFLVIAHPEPNQRSFCHAVYRKAIETLKLNNHEVVTADLYASQFTNLPSLKDFGNADPKLSYAEHQRRSLYNEDILLYQSRIEWCTHLMLFTPLYWLSPNSALMGWWEKVFGEGWAFAPSDKFDKGHMLGKKAMVVVTCGQTQDFYGKESINVTVEELMYPLTFRCFAKCGFTPLRSQAFFGLQTADAQTRVDMLNGWAEHVMTLETREEIPYQLEGDTMGLDTKKVTPHKVLAELGDLEVCKPKDPYAFNFD